ncbi:MAG: hypothetical protein ACLU80_10080 [Dorea sp.]
MLGETETGVSGNGRNLSVMLKFVNAETMSGKEEFLERVLLDSKSVIR